MFDLDGGEVSSGSGTLEALNAVEEALAVLDPRMPALSERVLEHDPGEPVTRVLRAVGGGLLGQPWAPAAELAAARRGGLTDREASLLQIAQQWAAGGPVSAAGPVVEHFARWPDDGTALGIGRFALVLSGLPGARARGAGVSAAGAARRGPSPSGRPCR